MQKNLFKNFFQYITLIIFIAISIWIWNEVLLPKIITISLVSSVVTYPIFNSNLILNILIVFFLSLLIFVNRSFIKNYILRAWKSFIVFGPLNQHYILILLLVTTFSVLILKPFYYQKAFLFNGDYIVIQLFVLLISITIKQSFNSKCPKIIDDLSGEAPIKTFEEDRLNFIELVSSISANITTRENGHGAVCIEIRGEWGSGKTSLMNLLNLHFQQQNKQTESDIYKKVRPMFINVSKFENVKLLYVHFFYLVIKKLEEEFILPRIDSKVIWSNFLEKLSKGLYISAIQNRTMTIPQIEEYLSKISKWLCLSDLRIICFIDDVDRLMSKELVGVFNLIRLVKHNMNNVVLLIASDQDVYKKYYKYFNEK